MLFILLQGSSRINIGVSLGAGGVFEADGGQRLHVSNNSTLHQQFQKNLW